MKKKIENIWYYHKITIILTAVVLASAMFVLLQNIGKPSPAKQVAVISTDYYSDESVKSLEDAFSSIYEYPVAVKIYTVELGADNQDPSVIGALDADLVARVSETFLLKNVASFKEATNNLPVTEPVPVSEIDGIKDLGFNDLYLVRRLPQK